MNEAVLQDLAATLTPFPGGCQCMHFVFYFHKQASGLGPRAAVGAFLDRMCPRQSCSSQKKKKKSLYFGNSSLLKNSLRETLLIFVTIFVRELVDVNRTLW